MIKSKWTLNDEKTLIALVASGKTKRQTAEAMGRTPASVSKKIQGMAQDYFIRLPTGWEEGGEVDRQTTWRNSEA
jgi:hypothetical protein